MKMIIMALAAVVVLGGGAAGAYFFFAAPAEAAGGELSEVEQAELDAKIKAEEEAAIKENVRFVDIDPLILPILDGNGVSQVVSVVIAIEIPGNQEVFEIQKMSPRLKDAYIQDMYGVLNRKASMSGGVIEVGQLKERLTKITKRILGEDKVNDVLLQVVQQRPI